MSLPFINIPQIGPYEIRLNFFQIPFYLMSELSISFVCFCIPFVQNFTKAGEQEAVRCDTQAQLIKRGCKREEIISPKNNLTIVKKDPLSTSFNQQEPVQLSPQKISLRLRPG